MADAPPRPRTPERRLAAILAADVAGYARLMAQDEAATVRDLKAHLGIVAATVARFGGAVVDTAGDGFLAAFPSAVRAVECAVAIQKAMTVRNRTVPAARRMLFRIGVNLGDVIHADARIFGDGVNVAARLQELAEPGRICISGTIHDLVRDKLDWLFEYAGEHALKNIVRPVRVYRAVPAGAGRSEPALPPLPDLPSIAVLPFQSMSSDAEQEYFADGMVEDIITALSRVRRLLVIARNSSFAYKGRSVDVKQVGRELGVRYVLEGSVRKVGERVRITGQLIDASSGLHLWAERFDGDLTDIFDLQDRVAASVAGTIAPRLEQAEIERARRKPTESLDAYDLYLRGMAAFHRFTRPHHDEALALFERAISLDPEFAVAHGMAARCYLQRRGYGWVGDRAQEAAAAERLARRAADLGKDDAAVLATAGIVLTAVVGNLDDGTALNERALALNPHLAWAWLSSSVTKVYIGEPEAGIEHAARAMQLSPMDLQFFAMQTFTALAHFLCGRNDAAQAWANTALRERPNFVIAAAVAAASNAAAGKPAEAQAAMARLRQLNPALRLAMIGQAFPFRRAEDVTRWVDGLCRAGLPE